MKKLILILLLTFPLLARAEDFTEDENGLFMQFITSQLGQQSPTQIAAVFGQLLSQDPQANAQIKAGFSAWLDGEIAKAQASKAGLEAARVAEEVRLDAEIEKLETLKGKVSP